MAWPAVPNFTATGTGGTDAWFTAPTVDGPKVFAMGAGTFHAYMFQRMQQQTAQAIWFAPPRQVDQQPGVRGDGQNADPAYQGRRYSMADVAASTGWEEAVQSLLYDYVAEAASTLVDSLDAYFWQELSNDFYVRNVGSSSLQVACWVVGGSTEIPLAQLRVANGAIRPVWGAPWPAPDDGSIVIFDPTSAPSAGVHTNLSDLAGSSGLVGAEAGSHGPPSLGWLAAATLAVIGVARWARRRSG